MKWISVPLQALLGATIACSPVKESPAFDTLDFSYFLVKYDGFSMRFNQSDTVLLRQYDHPDKPNSLQADRCYWGLISPQSRNQLDSMIRKVDLNSYPKLDSEIYDIDRYGFVLRKRAVRQALNVVADTPPKELEALKKWMIETKAKIRFTPVDSLVYFESSGEIIMLGRMRTEEELRRERLIL